MNLRYDGKLMNFITTVCENVLLNLVFLLCCVPIVTAGAALTALYTVQFKQLRGEGGYLMKNFFIALGSNFRNATIGTMMFAGISAVLSFLVTFWYYIGSVFSLAAISLLGLLFLMMLCCMLYFYPLLARHEGGVRMQLKNSMGLACLHWKTTLMLLLILAAAVVGEWYLRSFRIFFGVIGYSFVTYLNAYILNRTLYREEACEE